MAKEKLFDWFNFLNKKILKSTVFHIKKNICMSLWADKNISIGESFDINALIANPWNCPVNIDLDLKVTPYTFFATKKKAEKLVFPRQWRIQLSPCEIAHIKFKGYTHIGCKTSTISFNKARISKQGKGKQLFKYQGKSLCPTINFLGFLLLPFGWLVISWNKGASIKLKVSKDKMKMQDIAENIPKPEIEYKTIWSFEKPDELNLTPLLDAYFKNDNYDIKTNIENMCNEAFSKWSQKYRKEDPSLNTLRAGAEQNQQEVPFLVS